MKEFRSRSFPLSHCKALPVTPISGTPSVLWIFRISGVPGFTLFTKSIERKSMQPFSNSFPVDFSSEIRYSIRASTPRSIGVDLATTIFRPKSFLARRSSIRFRLTPCVTPASRNAARTSSALLPGPLTFTHAVRLSAEIVTSICEVDFFIISRFSRKRFPTLMRNVPISALKVQIGLRVPKTKARNRRGVR